MTPPQDTMTGDLAFGFDNSFARLPDRFFARMQPTPVPAPRLVRLNAPLARHLGLDPERLATPDGVGILAGNRLARDAAPLSMAYAGHQFGVWVPQLGDGRAILLGEVIDRDGVRRDIQLKGSGRCCASISSARRWRRSASRPPGRSLPSPPARRLCASARCRAPS